MRPFTIASLLATVFFATSIHAQDGRSASADNSRWLSIPEVHAKMEAAGYRNIEKIERESGSYEVKAIDQAGQRVKLYVHPQTGEVLEQQRKRDKYGSSYAKGNLRNSADCNERRCRDDLPQQGAPQPAAGK